MIISGVLSQYSTEIYGQDEFSLDVFISNSNNMQINIGGSGYLGTIYLSNGKIIDSSSRFLSSYQENSDLDLRIAFKTGLYSLWKNDDLLIADKKLSLTTYTTGASSITGVFLISNDNEEKDVTMSLYGQRPSAEFSNIYSDDLTLYTGTITFPNSSARLNEISCNRGEIISYTASKSNLISYVISGLNMYSGDYLDIDFSTNAGLYQESLLIDYTKPTEITGSFYISIGSVNNIQRVESGVIQNIQFNDFSLTSSWPVSTDLDVYLRYNSRRGQTPVSGSGVGSGLYVGYINGSGYIYSSALTGILDTWGVTGVGTGSVFTYTTGIVTYEYLVSAIGYEGGNLSTGYIYGELTGTVGPGSGSYLFNQNVIGTPTISIWDGGVNSSPAGVYTGSVNQQVVLSKYLSIYSSGDFYGTGYLALSGSISGFNLITGEPVEFNRDIDDYDAIYSNYFNYKENLLISGNYLKNPYKTTISGGLYNYYGRIIYEKEGLPNVSDSVSLIVSNQYDTREFNIVGYSL